jgi:O-acetyl-ADP-ribose deacetylase (regulator of RNase III)
MQLVVENTVRTVAFPSISTGVYGFPVQRASRIAVETVIKFMKASGKPEEVRFVVFSHHDYEVYASLFRSQLQSGPIT